MGAELGQEAPEQRLDGGFVPLAGGQDRGVEHRQRRKQALGMTAGKVFGDPARAGQITLTGQRLGEKELGVIHQQAAALHSGAEAARRLPPVAPTQRLDGSAEPRPLHIHWRRAGSGTVERHDDGEDEREEGPHA